MRTAVLASSLCLALAPLAPLVAVASPARVAPPVATAPIMSHAPVLPATVKFVPRCADHSCKSWVAVNADGTIHADALPNGFGPPDLQAAYHIDPTLGDGVTVAVVDAYGYAAIESDLAVYRSTYGLPPCTIASGCLTVVNDNGQTSPLPADNAEWIGETALDVDMVSAACPKCKIVVVQAGAAGNAGLEVGQIAAAKLGVNAISDSWGGIEDGTESTSEGDFNNPGIGTFVSSGDYGYNTPFPNMTGPDYPATSAHVITVGGTHLTKVDVSVNPRGYVETAWSQAGSSCSVGIAKPAYQPATAACGKRAASDVSAVADPATGLATYVAAQGGWTVTGGTSAASPFTAAMFAAAGHGDAVPEFVYKHPSVFLDVNIGQNGSCGTNLCVAGTGWDGPTGLGTTDQSKLVTIGNMVGAGPSITITYPTDGASVSAGFSVATTPGSGTNYVELEIDGARAGAVNTAPYQFTAPTSLADGAHTLKVTAFDIDHNSQSTMVNITQGGASGGDGGGGGGGGGCAAGGSGASLGALGALGLAFARRRRR